MSIQIIKQLVCEVCGKIEPHGDGASIPVGWIELNKMPQNRSWGREADESKDKHHVCENCGKELLNFIEVSARRERERH